MKSIDIMLPYWGEFSLLKETIDSVVAQTNGNWRLIIIDDHYPSLEAYNYCNSIKNEKITYIRHKKNIGITNNFNFSIEKVTAEYCMILGCDDVLLPNYVEISLKNIGDNDFYQPGVEIIDGNSKTYLPLPDIIKKMLRPNRSGVCNGEKLATSLCRGNWLYFPSITWKTSTIKKYRFDAKYKILEDVVLELNLIKDGGKLFVDTITTFRYRRFDNSLSSKEKAKGGVRFQEENEVYDSFATTFKELNWTKASRAARLRVTSRIHQMLTKK